MATEVVHVIDPDMGTGYDYDSLFDWEAGEQGDLTGARNEIAIAKCRCTAGTADTTTFSINGWTTSATQYIKIWTDTAESYRHNGAYETGNKYRLQAATGTFLEIKANYVTIDGLQFVSTADPSGYAIGSFNAYGGSTIKNCVIHSTAGTKANITAIYFSSSHTTAPSFIINNVIDNFKAAVETYSGSTSSRTIFYNNTVYNCTVGFKCKGNAVIAKNNLVIGCTDCYSETAQFEVSDYNAYDEGTDPGTNGINLSAYTDAQIFSDVASSNFHLASGSPAIGVGANLYADTYYAFQVDIDGNDRGGSGASWDIGADEYIAAVSSTALPRRALDGPFYGSLRGSVR